MHANPISGYCHYVTSVTKMCEARCVAGHGVSQGTLKGVMCGGTPFQDTANSIDKIYPKRLSELKASFNRRLAGDIRAEGEGFEPSRANAHPPARPPPKLAAFATRTKAGAPTHFRKAELDTLTEANPI